jgi:hypothetical protein
MTLTDETTYFRFTAGLWAGYLAVASRKPVRLAVIPWSKKSIWPGWRFQNGLRRRPGSSGALAAGTHNRICSSPEGVRTIKKKEVSGVKRVNINVEVSLHNAFKAATAAQGVDMTTVLMEYIQNYVAKHGSNALKPKGRRA